MDDYHRLEIGSTGHSFGIPMLLFHDQSCSFSPKYHIWGFHMKIMFLLLILLSVYWTICMNRN